MTTKAAALLAVAGLAAAGCRSMCVTDACRAQYDDPAQRAAMAAAFASGGQAFAAGMQGAPPPSSGCGSDYDCGGGMQCAKAYNALRGTCLRTVDAYGNQAPALASPASVGQGQRTCYTSGDCPVGFWCDAVGCVKKN